MLFNRSVSAPPVDKFILPDDVELDEIRTELKYTNYFRKKKDPRLDPPRFLFKGQSSYWASEHNDFILKAFTEKKTGVEMIDMDHPESESCSEFSGKSRTNTPVGENVYCIPDLVQKDNILIPISISSSSPQKMDESSMMNEIKSFYQNLGLEPCFNTGVICVEVCKDQEGSRFIQNAVDTWTPEQISYFFSQIVGSAYSLSMNLFGNYVIQKIIPFLNEDELFKLILQFFGHIYELSLHVYGCRVIQKLLDNLDDIKSIVAELESHIGELIESPNGNHVIQKCIDKNIDKDFLIREFENNTVDLARQRYGCRVLQRIFEVCTEDETWAIYLNVIKSIEHLINDKYGNYVIQHLIETPNKLKEQIFSYIIANSFMLSKDKFSSNVVERCVNNSTEKQLEAFLDQFSKCMDGGKPCLYYMCIDMYANYVVQRFFDVADAELKAKAKNLVRPFIKEMKAIPFTKHILSRFA